MIKIVDMKSKRACIIEKDKLFSVDMKEVDNEYVFILTLTNNANIEIGKERDYDFANQILGKFMSALRNDMTVIICIDEKVVFGISDAYWFTKRM